MMKPILYSSVNCPHSLKVAIFLTEKGVDFHRVEVDLSQKQQKSPEYLAKNPNGTVPAYEDERGVIGDSFDIMRYIDYRDHRPSLIPMDVDGVRQTVRWIQRADQDFWDVSHHLYWQLIEPPQNGTDWTEVERLKTKGIDLLTDLEAILSNQPYVMGDKISVVDLVLVPWVYGYQRFDLPEKGRFPYVERWRDALSQRPSFTQNYKIAGEPFEAFLARQSSAAGS